MAGHEILLEAGTNELELLIFHVAGQPYGMNVLKVQSIQLFEPEKTVSVPEADPAIVGLMLYRGKPISLIDLSIALELEEGEARDTRMVIVTEFNRTVTGFLVDHVDRIRRMSWTEFAPLNKFLESPTQTVTGSIRVDDADVLVVDLEYILSSISPKLALRDEGEGKDVAKHDSREAVKVFFVDDSTPIRRRVSQILNNNAYSNLTAYEDGQEVLDALEVIRDGGTDELPDVVICDIEMPRMDGLTLCKRVKSDPQLSHIPFVMFSSLVNRQLAAKCEAVGAEEYVAKPEVGNLLEKLDSLCLEAEAV